MRDLFYTKKDKGDSPLLLTFMFWRRLKHGRPEETKEAIRNQIKKKT